MEDQQIAGVWLLDAGTSAGASIRRYSSQQHLRDSPVTGFTSTASLDQAQQQPELWATANDPNSVQSPYSNWSTGLTDVGNTTNTLHYIPVGATYGTGLQQQQQQPRDGYQTIFDNDTFQMWMNAPVGLEYV